MKLVRNAATTYDSENKEHRRNRGRIHFYQVEGNPSNVTRLLNTPMTTWTTATSLKAVKASVRGPQSCK